VPSRVPRDLTTSASWLLIETRIGIRAFLQEDIQLDIRSFWPFSQVSNQVAYRARTRADTKRPLSRHFATKQARLLMVVLAYNLLQMIRQFYLVGEEVKGSMEWLIKRLTKVGAKVAYHGRRWQVHVASAFSITIGQYLGRGTRSRLRLTEEPRERYARTQG